MAAAFNFGKSARASARFEDRAPTGQGRHYVERVVVGELAAGSSKIALNLTPAVALALSRELRRAALSALQLAAQAQ